MSLDFAEVKKVRIVDVAGKYGIRLRYRGEWASAPCPLPTHKAGDKARSFTINLPQNYWRCFSATCNQNNEGRKGGDVINFVALMENCRERDAAQKLAEWYGLNGNKTAPQTETRPVRSESTPSKDSPEPSTPAIAVKGFVGALDGWFDEVFGIGPELKDDPFWRKCRNAVKSKVIESYRNGKAAAHS